MMLQEKFSFFLVVSLFFFGVHHIILDNVLWRIGQDTEVRKALLEG